MKLFATLLLLLIVGILTAVPVSCVMDRIQQEREEREFRRKYGSDVEQLNRGIREYNRIRAEQAWERKQMERIRKEMPR